MEGQDRITAWSSWGARRDVLTPSGKDRVIAIIVSAICYGLLLAEIALFYWILKG